MIIGSSRKTLVFYPILPRRPAPKELVTLRQHSQAIYSHQLHSFHQNNTMNKRDKKRLEVLKKLKQRFQLQISGAKKQEVEVDEVASLERELAKIDEEITKLKSA